MQFTAMGFFVARMAGIAASSRARARHPRSGSRRFRSCCLSPLAGVVADRLPRRRVLVVTNATMALAALVLALLATTHRLDMSSFVLHLGAELGG